MQVNTEDLYQILREVFTDEGREVFERLMKAFSRNQTTMEIDKEVYDRLVKVHDENIIEEERGAKTAHLNNIGIAKEKDGDIDGAIEAYEENMKIGVKASFAYDRLRILYKKRKDFVNMERAIRRKCEVYEMNPQETEDEVKHYTIKITPVLPTIAKPFTVVGETLGKKLESAKRLLPEFEFYTQIAHTSGSLGIAASIDSEPITNKKKIDFDSDVFMPYYEIGGKLLELASKAEKYDYDKRYDLSAPIYEELVSNQTDRYTAYDKLISIYRQSKLYMDEKRILDIAIDYFTEKERKDKEYVIELAKKYGKLDFLEERLSNGKGITYYYGIFPLYVPTKYLEKWKRQRESLLNKYKNIFT